MALAKWGVVSLMDEPPELIASFAAYHLWAGASQVHIYLDRENAIAQALLSGLSSVEVTLCDGAFWAALGRLRPAYFPARQSEIANHAASISRSDYLIHLGGSEFLYQTSPLETELSQLPDGAALMISNLERVDIEEAERSEIFSSEFRIPAEQLETRDLTLDATGLTRFGMTGHASGRTFAPLGFGYHLGAHRPYLAQSEPRKYPDFQRAEGTRILHFDGLTPLDWIYKRLRVGTEQSARPHQPASAQVLAQYEAIKDDPRGTYDRLKQISAAQVSKLSDAGLITRIDFDPRRAIDALIPLDRINLSCAQFDDWIKREKAALLAEHRLNSQSEM